MKYAYFPGCSMEGSGKAYGDALGYINPLLGIEFCEIEDWNCCGASVGPASSRQLGLALPARNLALAAKQQPQLPLAVPCAACYGRLKQAAAAQGAEQEQLSRLIEMAPWGHVEVRSILEVYNTPAALAALAAAITRPLKGLRLACYYGCLYSRPTKLTGALDSENPQEMDTLLRLTGAECLDWAFKTECCGAAHHVEAPRTGLSLLYPIFKNARAAGAQALVTACPMCMMNLDMRQKAVNRHYAENFAMPVYFFCELLAVAMGASPKEAGISRHFHPAEGLLKKISATEGAV